jgi:hypothetical protein
MNASKTSSSATSGSNPLITLWRQALSSTGPGITPNSLVERMKATMTEDIAKNVEICLEDGDDSGLALAFSTHEKRFNILQSPLLQKAFSFCLTSKRAAPTSDPTLDGFTSASPNSKRPKPNGVSDDGDSNRFDAPRPAADMHRTTQDDEGNGVGPTTPAVTKANAKKAGRPKKQQESTDPPKETEAGDDEPLSDDKALEVFGKVLEGFSNNTTIQNNFQKNKIYKEKLLTFLVGAEMPTASDLNAHLPTWLTDAKLKESSFDKQLPGSLRSKIADVDNLEQLDLAEILQVAIVYALSQGTLRADAIPSLLRSVPRIVK